MLRMKFSCPPFAPGNDYIIPGGWTDAKVDQEIVDFALSQFSGISEECYNIEVENFQSQVASTLV